MIGTIAVFALAALAGDMNGCQPDSSMARAVFAATVRLRGRTDDDDAIERVEWIGPADSDTQVHWALVDRDSYSGAFALVRCDGRVLGVHGSGMVDSVWLASVTRRPFREAVVECLCGHGTGWSRHSFAILGFDSDSIRALLDLVTIERSNDPAADGYHEDSTTVKLSTDGTVVRTGLRFTLSCPADPDKDCRETRPAPIHERYRWDRTNGRFVQVGGGRRS